MKVLFSLILSAALIGGFNDIARINAMKKEAKEAYNNGDYEAALKHYELLSDSLSVDDDNILLNLANSYFKVQDTTKAINNYSRLTASSDKIVRSVAHQQLGIIKNREKQFEEALSHFKESLKADPLNEDSRYNYELLKKVLEEQEKQEQENQDQNKDQNKDEQDEQNKEEQENKDQDKENQEQENQENKDGQEKDQEEQEGDKKEEENKEGKPEDQEEKEAEEKEGEQKEGEEEESKEPSFSDKLKEMNISEDKARMILEAMKNNEIQYYQQNKRKAKKKKDSSKPDW